MAAVDPPTFVKRDDAPPDWKFAPSVDSKYDTQDYPTYSHQNMPGHPGHTTEEQMAMVHQLRMMLEADGYTTRLDTITLLRFLRARKFNVQLAHKMFVDSETWRAEFEGGVDNLVRTFDYTEKEKVFEHYPQYYHKTDVDGRPVYIEQLGKIDLTALYKITTQERMTSNLVVEYEKVGDPRLPACSRKAGHLLETCCSIMDLKGVGISSATSAYTYMKSISAIMQNYYPERLGKLYVINAPWGFSAIFSVIKGFLDPVTVEKIHVLGWDYQKQLLAQIPAENLPKIYGGECECEGGCELSDAGPWQDPKYARTPKWATTETGAEGKPAAEPAAAATESKPAEAAATADAPAPAAAPIAAPAADAAPAN